MSCADSFEAVTRLFATQLLEAVGAGPRTKLLDVACGRTAASIRAVELAIERDREDGVFKIPAAAIWAVGVKHEHED